MSENKRVSNETLGKVVVQVVKNLEKNLKTSEKAQLVHQEELKKLSNNITSNLHQGISHLNEFKIDLSPLDVKMNNYLEEINKTAEKARKDIQNPMISFKFLGLFFGLFVATLIFFYFFNRQARELEQERSQKQHFIRFIEASDNRIKDYQKWTKEL